MPGEGQPEKSGGLDGLDLWPTAQLPTPDLPRKGRGLAENRLPCCARKAITALPNTRSGTTRTVGVARLSRAARAMRPHPKGERCRIADVAVAASDSFPQDR